MLSFSVGRCPFAALCVRFLVSVVTVGLGTGIDGELDGVVVAELVLGIDVVVVVVVDVVAVEVVIVPTVGLFTRVLLTLIFSFVSARSVLKLLGLSSRL